MPPNKNGKVIFATHSEKIDQPRQVPPTELTQNIESLPFLFPPLKFQKKSLPPPPPHTPPHFHVLFETLPGFPLYKGAGGTMKIVPFLTQ